MFRKYKYLHLRMTIRINNFSFCVTYLQVGMQNSSLGVVLATAHFTSSMVALPPAMSAVIMNMMGSTLGFFWRYIDPSDSKASPKTVDK